MNLFYSKGLSEKEKKKTYEHSKKYLYVNQIDVRNYD